MYRDNGGDSFVWFLAGAAVGAAVALLLAPQSGEKTRHLLANRAGEGKESIIGRGREIFEKGREFADDAAQMFERGKNLGQG